MVHMNKVDLINELATRLGQPKKYCDDILFETIFGDNGIILSNLNDPGDKIRLTGFGVFSVTERKARKARNPKTGTPVNVAAKTVRKFKFSNESKTL